MERPDVISFIKTQLLSRTEYYELYGQVDDLSCGGRIEDVNVIGINYEAAADGGVNFSGVISVEAVKDVGITRSSFTGTFEGYYDGQGIYLESASLDVSTSSG